MDTLEKYLRQLGAELFPLRRCVVGDPQSKAPLEPDWRTKTYTRDQIVAYADAGHAIGWRLGPRDIVLDVDVSTPERPHKRGDVARPFLENLQGGETTIVESPTGGRHYYFVLPDGESPSMIRTKVKELPDVDILRHGQYVVIAGSPHWQGGYYQWSSMTQLFDEMPQTLSQNILHYLRRDPKIESAEIEESRIKPSILDTILRHLPVTDYRDHGDWFGIMAASHWSTEGTDDGLESFLHWSTSDPKYAGDSDKIAKRWKSLDPNKSQGYTLGTLLHELRHGGHESVIDSVRAMIDFGDNPEFTAPDTIDTRVFDVAPPEPADIRPRIEKISDDRVLNDQFIEIMASKPEIFARLDHLYYCSIQGQRLESYRMLPVSICEALSHYCRFGERKGKIGKWIDTPIAEKHGKQIEARGGWKGVRTLNRFSAIPIMTPHGVHQKPGFESYSGIFYFAVDMDKIPKIPRRPTKEDALEALLTILEIVEEFPFAAPCHRSAWLASLLGVVARPIVGDCAPMTIIDANRAGAGKGMLCDLISDICLAPGERLAKFTGLDKNDEEQRKMFLALARENPPMALFDNLKSGSSLGSPVLDAILTAGAVSGRVLGITKIANAVFDSVLFATGNRLSIDPDSDMIRRILYILLETTSERPEKRKFKFPDLRAHVKANRGKYVAAALTIMEAARLNCDDLPPVTPWGSYGGYSLIRRALLWLGEPDPRESVEDLSSKQQATTELAQVLEAMEAIGLRDTHLTAREIWDRLSTGDEFEENQDRKALFEEYKRALVPPWVKSDPVKSVGAKLSRSYRDQMHDGRWLRVVPDPHKKVNRFKLEYPSDDEILF